MSTLMILTVDGKAIAIFWGMDVMQHCTSLIEGISDVQASELHTTGETVGEFGKAVLEFYELGSRIDQYKGVKIGIDAYEPPF